MIDGSPNVRHVLFSGDWHGNIAFARDVLELAVRAGADVVVQCGDFGMWEHADGGAYLDGLEVLVRHYAMPIVWIDGNHDNHPLLWSKYPGVDGGFTEVREGVLYAPRGHRWTWWGVQFLAMGGAYSIDKKWRIQAETRRGRPESLYWPTELITDEQLELAMLDGPTDIVVCHDCPAGVDVLGSHHSDDWVYFPQSEGNRQKLRQLVEATRPKLVVHGHFHVRNSDVIDLPSPNSVGGIDWHRVRVESLGADVSSNPLQEAVVILDLADLELSPVA